MTALDVRAEVADLQRSIVGMRCSNVYDFQVRKIWRQFDTVIVYRHVLPDLPQDNKRRMYMLKLFRADQPKLFLILESGRRIHCTQYARYDRNSNIFLQVTNGVIAEKVAQTIVGSHNFTCVGLLGLKPLLPLCDCFSTGKSQLCLLDFQ